MLSRRIGLTALLLTIGTGDLRAQVVLSPTHYDVAFTLDYDAQLLQGATRITLRNPSNAPVRMASLLLYRLLRVQAVRDDRGRSLRFSQSVVAFEDFTKQQVNQLLVTLPEPLAADKQVAIEVQYGGHLLGYAETGMRYIQDRIDTTFTILRPDARAYPEPGFPSYEANRTVATPEFSYSARITVPKGLTVANGGRLDGVDTAGANVTYRYSSLKPSWRMDFAVARFTVVSSGSLRIFHLPGDSAGAAGVARAAGDALDRFTRWFGPRPNPTPLTFIEIPDGWGSQADVTAVLQSAAAFKDARSHDEVYHEISHLWNVAASERPSPRWEEGLASFLEDLVTEEVSGTPVVSARGEKLMVWLRGQLPTRERWRAVPLVDYGRARMTDLSYSMGAIYFHLLYRLAGRDGFNSVMRQFVEQFHSGGGTTKDLADLVRKTATIDLDLLNNDWLFTTGWAGRVAQSASLDDLETYYRRVAKGQ